MLLYLYFFTASLVSILLFATILKLLTQKKTENVEDRIPNEKSVISPETVKLIHNGSLSKKVMNVWLLKIKYRNTKEDRIEENIKIMNLEKGIHEGSEIKTIVCLKNCLYPSVYKTVHEDNNPGFVRKYLPWVETISEKLEADNLQWLRWLVIKVRKISSIYIDLFKDLFLAASIFVLNGSFQGLILFPTKMTSVVVFCLFSSILVSMLLSSMDLAIERINQSKDNLKLKQKCLILLKSLFLSPIHPLFLMNKVENLKEELMSICRKDTIAETANDKKILEIKDSIDNLERSNSSFMKTEIQLETIPQMTLQFLLLFLAITHTPTTGGLEEMFKKADPALLVISLIWSLLSVTCKTIKFMSLEKAFFPLIPKLVAALFALSSTSTKILVNVMFFAPSLGLFHILGHWQAEQLTFASKGDMLQIYNQTIPWSMVDRWRQGEPPSYTLYTAFDLVTSSKYFVVLNLLQAMIIFIVKRATSPHFKTASCIKQIVHCLENTSIPVPFKDWDVESGNVKEHRQRFKEVVTEVLTTLVVNKLIGFLMLLPLICTGKENLLKKISYILF